MNDRQISSLDILSFFAFFIGLANFEETMTQSSVQNVVQEAVDEIHQHLKEQDEKIDRIIEMVGGKV